MKVEEGGGRVVDRLHNKKL